MKTNARHAAFTVALLALLTGCCLCILFACQSAPVVKQSLTVAPPASVQVQAAADHVADAGKMVATTTTHLQAAQAADTLPAAKAEVAKAQASNQGASDAVQAAQTILVAAIPQAKAQEKAGAHCEAKLQATKDYAWLRVMLITVGSSAFALEILLLAVLAFGSLASSTILAAIPILGNIITGARSALYLLIAELTVAVATCAYLASHIAASVDFGFLIAVGGVVYLAIRFAIKHHIFEKSLGEFKHDAPQVMAQIKEADAKIKPAGLWIEHKVAAGWHWLAGKICGWLPHKVN